MFDIVLTTSRKRYSINNNLIISRVHMQERKCDPYSCVAKK